MLVRLAVPDDALAMEQVRVAGWRAAYRGLIADRVLDELTVQEDVLALRRSPPPDVRQLVAVEGSDVIGMSVCGPPHDGLDPAEFWTLRALYVAPGTWRAGVGSALLAAGVDGITLPRQSLYVLDGNVRAQAFYARHGFALDGASQTRDGFTELRMQRSL